MMDDVSLSKEGPWQLAENDPDEAPSPIELSFDKGVLVGRIRDPSPVSDRVAIYVDDERCGSALVSQSKDGERQFDWLVPTRFYDRKKHTASIRLEHDVEVGTLSLAFPEKYRPNILSEVRLSPDGKLVGYAHNANWGRKRLDLELWLGAQIIAKARCDQPNPDFAPADVPEDRGFVVDLSGKKDALLDYPLRIVVPELDDVISDDPYLLNKSFRLDAVSIADVITATIACPDRFRDHAFEVFIDGKPVSYSHRRISGARVLTIACDDLGRGDAAALSIRARNGADIGGSPAIIARSAFGGVRNPRFERWTASAPADWIVAEDVTVRPIASGAAAGLAVEIGGERSPALPILSQALDLGAAGTHIQLAVRARARGGAVIRAGGRGSDGASLESAAPITGAWADYSLRLALPSPAARKGAVLEITVADAQFGRVDFAQIEIPRREEAAGAQSAGGLSGRAQDDPGPWSAVINGGLERWSKGFEFPVTDGRRELADGWFSRAKKDSPAARVRLAPILEPKTGSEPAKTRYGLEISGVVGGSTFALEATLEKQALARHLAHDLVFVSALAVTVPGQRVDRPSLIRRIAVVRRAPTGESEVLTTITNNLAVGRAPRRHRLSISRAAADLIQTTAHAHPESDLLLRFEFGAGPSDVVIADVSFGRAAEGAVSTAVAQSPPTSGYLAFEDPTIIAQLGRLNGVELWTSPTPVTAIKVAAAAPSRPWSWGESRTTVDIIIPVHNAQKEVEACLDALERRTGRPHRLILVNDKSNLATSQFLRAYAVGRPWVSLIENPENLGYTRSSNIGLRASDAEWVVLLNSDTIVSDDWLEGMLECAGADPQTAMVGPVSNAATWQSVPEMRDPRGGWLVNALPPGMSVDELGALVRESSSRHFPEVPLLNGFCTLMRRDVIAAVGFLDEQAFPVGYGEENDLCIRVKKAGYDLRIADHIYVYHSKSASFGSTRRMALAKQGRKACDAKHPDVSLDALTQVMADCQPLIELRASLKRALRP